MADAQQEAAQLRAAIERLASDPLRTHMLRALDAFEHSDASQARSSAAQTTDSQQPACDRDDTLAVALRGKRVMVQNARDALFLVVHGLMLESGFHLDGSAASTDELTLPTEWDANSANGLFTANYHHANDLSIQFELQALFVGNKLEVYISEGTDKTHSIELSVDAHVATTSARSEPALGADLLRNLDALRQQVVPFLANIVPAKRTAAATRAAGVSSPPPPPPTRPSGDTDSPFPAPSSLPPVGSGDVLPPGLGGGEPGMLVGPDSALFGHRFDPSRGPVPGARFDPYGPPIDPLRMPSRSGRPAPNMPFGTPNPDHLRMPREDDDLNFGFGGVQPPRGRGSGGGGFGSHQPFGSDHSFF